MVEPTPVVTRLGGVLGATVAGVEITAQPADVVRVLRDALLRHRVLFIRPENDVSDRDLLGFAAGFGAVNLKHPLLSGRAHVDGVSRLDSAEMKLNQWHSDITYVPKIPEISMARAVTVPPFGGDTTWADTARAYARLPSPLRALADELRAVHVSGYFAELRGERRTDEITTQLSRRLSTAEHPVVQVHPETGERCLLLGLTARQFVGLSPSDHNAVHTLIQHHIENPSNTVRWHWTAGDVAIWDNRATQHFDTDDYEFHRVLHRLTIGRSAPVAAHADLARRALLTSA